MNRISSDVDHSDLFLKQEMSLVELERINGGLAPIVLLPLVILALPMVSGCSGCDQNERDPMRPREMKYDRPSIGSAPLEI